MKKNELKARLAKLKKEAIKKMQEQGVYKGPQDELLSDPQKNPEKDKIKMGRSEVIEKIYWLLKEKKVEGVKIV